MSDYDVIVVGAGNAAQSAAMSALENGAKKVAILEKANEEMRGGNTHWSGGILRIAFDDSKELAPFLPGVEEKFLNFYDGIQPYTKKKYMEDLLRVTSGRSDPILANILVNNSYDTVKWAVDTAKIECEPACHVCGVQVNGQWTFPGGVVIRAKHEGKGLSAAWFKATKNAGIDIRYGSGALQLIQNDKGKVIGVITKEDDGIKKLYANAVVLGCGGFEANSQMRAQYLGAPWDTAKVRGTSFNQGDGLRMALSIGAMPFGQWTGRHSTPIDANWPDHADRKRGDQSNRLSYSFGIIINRDGLRFVDEGEDTKLYTYAKFGAQMLKQPGGIAYQIFDQKTIQHLEPRYKTGKSVEANTLEELVQLMDIENREYYPLRAIMRALGKQDSLSGIVHVSMLDCLSAVIDMVDGGIDSLDTQEWDKKLRELSYHGMGPEIASCLRVQQHTGQFRASFITLLRWMRELYFCTSSFVFLFLLSR